MNFEIRIHLRPGLCDDLKAVREASGRLLAANTRPRNRCLSVAHWITRKPPMGVRPAYLLEPGDWAGHRLELAAAVNRYAQAGKPVPQGWLRELQCGPSGGS